jgi:hypothetical protein
VARLAGPRRAFAAALRRLATWVGPPAPPAGGPPEHWTALVAARAPALLRGEGMGVRGPSAPPRRGGPDPVAGQEVSRRPVTPAGPPPAPRPSHPGRRDTVPGARPSPVRFALREPPAPTRPVPSVPEPGAPYRPALRVVDEPARSRPEPSAGPAPVSRGAPPGPSTVDGSRVRPLWTPVPEPDPTPVPEVHAEPVPEPGPWPVLPAPVLSAAVLPAPAPPAPVVSRGGGDRGGSGAGAPLPPATRPDSGTRPGPARRHEPDPWPALPDDAPLWTVVPSRGDDRAGRLADEQAGR